LKLALDNEGYLMRWGISIRLIAPILLISLLAISISIISVYTHDNPEKTAPMDDINQGTVSAGTNVTVKGNIIQIRYYYLGSNDQLVTISDGTGDLTFIWENTFLDIGWTIIVKGRVNSNISIYAYSVEKVWLFI
jgi:DNA/RNA endonuclease YhcR with UshA esterase domain